MNNAEHTELSRRIQQLQRERQELLVVIDTLQTNLRSCMSMLPDDARDQVTQVRSYQWCIDWSEHDLEG